MLEAVKSVANRTAAARGLDVGVDLVRRRSATPVEPGGCGRARSRDLCASRSAVAALRQCRHRAALQLRTARLVSQAAQLGGADRLIPETCA